MHAQMAIFVVFSLCSFFSFTEQKNEEGKTQRKRPGEVGQEMSVQKKQEQQKQNAK